jgi:hypothetical protein
MVQKGVPSNSKLATCSTVFPLQEIVRERAPVRRLLAPCHKVFVLIILRCRRKDIEEAFPRVADLKHRCHVPAPVAVVGRAPDGAQPVVVEDLVAFLAELVRPQDVRHVVDGEELLDDLRAEGVACAARREGKFVTVRVWVGPDQVGHGAFVGDFAEAVDDFDLVDGMYGRREACVIRYQVLSIQA